jgi:hypothetical protein
MLCAYNITQWLAVVRVVVVLRHQKGLFVFLLTNMYVVKI